MINFARGWKFIGGFLLIIGAALAVWGTTMYLSPDARKAREAEDYLERLQAEYANDTYGGKTPEETLELFIDALEKGDIELASKYFLPEDREETQKYFEEIRLDNSWEQVLQDAHALKLTTTQESKAFFTIADNANRVVVQVVLYKNPNGVWKISDI